MAVRLTPPLADAAMLEKLQVYTAAAVLQVAADPVLDSVMTTAEAGTVRAMVIEDSLLLVRLFTRAV
jgi:hypothetical protein